MRSSYPGKLPSNIKIFDEAVYEKEFLQKFLSLLDSNNCKFRVNFSPNAGESTIIKGFVDIWNTVSRRKGVRSLTLTTNGSKFHVIIKNLDLTKLESVTLSLDGSQERIHDCIRGPGSFKAVITSMKMLEKMACGKDSKSFDIQINYTLNGLNASSLSSLPYVLGNFTHPLLINIIKVSLAQGNAKRNERILSISSSQATDSVREFFEELARINDARQENGLGRIRCRLQGFTAREIFSIIKRVKRIVYDDFLLYAGEGRFCGVLMKGRVVIDPFGNVFPCLEFTYKEVLNDFLRKFGKLEIPHISTISSMDGVLYDRFFECARDWIGELYLFENLPCADCSFSSTCTVCPIETHYRGLPDVCKQ